MRRRRSIADHQLFAPSVSVLVIAAMVFIGCSGIFRTKAQVSAHESNMNPAQFHQKYDQLNGVNIYKLLTKEEREQIFKNVFLSYDSRNFDRVSYSLKHQADKVIEGLDYNLRKYVVIFSQSESMDEAYLTIKPEERTQTARM